MAQVKLSALLSDLRGKLGGGTFQGNNGVLSLRNNNIGVNTKSSNKIKQQGQMKYLLDAWRNLTNEQRQLWNNFSIQAKIATNKNANTFLNGQSIFLKFNYYRYAVGLATLDTPSMFRTNLSNVNFTISNSFGVLSITSDRALLNNIEFAFVQISAPVQANNNYKKSTVKSIRQLITNGTNWDITQSYLNAFGFLPNAGDTVFIDVVLCDYVAGWQSFNGNYKLTVGGSDGYTSIIDNIGEVFSLRQVLPLTTGNLFRVKRASDNTQFTCTFTNGVIDYAGVDAFCNGTTCYVNRIYSQKNNNITINKGTSQTDTVYNTNKRIDVNQNTCWGTATPFIFAQGETNTLGFVMKNTGNCEGLVLSDTSGINQSELRMEIENGYTLNSVSNIMDINEEVFQFTVEDVLISNVGFSLLYFSILSGESSSTFRVGYNDDSYSNTQNINAYVELPNLFNQSYGGTDAPTFELKDIIFFNCAIDANILAVVNSFSNL